MMFTRLLKTSLLAAAAVGALTGGASAQTLKFAFVFPQTHWLWVHGGEIFAKAVEEGTGGNVTFVPFPSGQLGKETVSAIESGLAETGIVVPSYEPAKLPLTSVFELPGFHSTACEGTAKAWALLQEGGAVYEAEFKPQGLVPLYVNVLAPYQLVTTSKKVATLEDVAGLKLRANGTAMIKTASAIGAVPVTVTTTEFYDAMTRGTVDGGLWPIGSTKQGGLETVIHHTTRGAQLGGGVTVFAVGERVWDGLDDATKQVMRDAGQKTQQQLCEYLDTQETTVVEELVAAGTLEVVDLPPAEEERWAEKIATVGEDWAKELDSTGRPGTDTLNAYRDAPAGL
jgi:TRAP-type C4-dicarboxylate transport system substrate-binding protein